MNILLQFTWIKEIYVHVSDIECVQNIEHHRDIRRRKKKKKQGKYLYTFNTSNTLREYVIITNHRMLTTIQATNCTEFEHL
jgi:hypothetical protein